MKCADKNCHVDRELKMHATGQRTPSGKPIVCDPCLVPIVKALNDAGLTTVASCCGHGFRPGNIALADGREIIIARYWVEAREIDTLFPIDINGAYRGGVDIINPYGSGPEPIGPREDAA